MTIINRLSQHDKNVLRDFDDNISKVCHGTINYITDFGINTILKKVEKKKKLLSEEGLKVFNQLKSKISKLQKD